MTLDRAPVVDIRCPIIGRSAGRNSPIGYLRPRLVKDPLGHELEVISRKVRVSRDEATRRFDIPANESNLAGFRVDLHPGRKTVRPCRPQQRCIRRWFDEIAVQCPSTCPTPGREPTTLEARPAAHCETSSLLKFELVLHLPQDAKQTKSAGSESTAIAGRFLTPRSRAVFSPRCSVPPAPRRRIRRPLRTARGHCHSPSAR
jgi:hypothetical protein